MGLPGHRRTSSHKRRRAAHFALSKIVLAACPKCGKPIAPHRACKNCGTYNGRTVLSTDRAVARTLKRTSVRGGSGSAGKASVAPVPKAKKATKKAEAHDHDHAGESPKS